MAWALKYPYALPAITNALALAFSLILAVFGLKESLQSKENNRDFGVVLDRSVVRFIERIVLRRRSAGYAAIQLNEFPETATNEIAEGKFSKPLPSISQPPPLRFAASGRWKLSQ